MRPAPQVQPPADPAEPEQPVTGNSPADNDEQAVPDKRPAQASACDIQDGDPLPRIRLRGVGTEPFWAARIEGRCVTYMHPENQDGTRVWTKFAGSASSGTWAGALNGRQFELRTSPQPGCSDGMSDRRYPIRVDLKVDGEERSGCAEPL